MYTPEKDDDWIETIGPDEEEDDDERWKNDEDDD